MPVGQQADQSGTLTSRVFPGLWLDVDALLRGDLGGLQETVQRGCSAPEHAAFCARLGGE